MSALKRAHNAVEGIAHEAILSLAAVLLACGAVVLAAAGIALWMSTAMPLHIALLIAAFAVSLCSCVVFALSRQAAAPAAAVAAETENARSPLTKITKSLTSLAGPMDVVASGLFARQFKKSPVATLAATAAVGALLGMIVDADGDDD